MEKKWGKQTATKGDVEELARMTAKEFLTLGSKVDTGFAEIKGIMKDMLKEMGATHEDVRYIRKSVEMLTRGQAEQEAAIDGLEARMVRVERKVGL